MIGESCSKRTKFTWVQGQRHSVWKWVPFPNRDFSVVCLMFGVTNSNLSIATHGAVHERSPGRWNVVLTRSRKHSHQLFKRLELKRTKTSQNMTQMFLSFPLEISSSHSRANPIAEVWEISAHQLRAKFQASLLQNQRRLVSASTCFWFERDKSTETKLTGAVSLGNSISTSVMFTKSEANGA